MSSVTVIVRVTGGALLVGVARAAVLGVVVGAATAAGGVGVAGGRVPGLTARSGLWGRWTAGPDPCGVGGGGAGWVDVVGVPGGGVLSVGAAVAPGTEGSSRVTAG